MGHQLKLDELRLKIQQLITEHNEVVEENDLKQYLIYTEVESLAYNWNKNDITYISDIVESYQENPAWYSSSWCLVRD